MDKVINLARENVKPAIEFEMLLRPHFLHLYRIAYRFTGDCTDAEDLVQDVLLKIYPRRKELFTVDKLQAWLTRVLYHTFIDQKRKFNRSPFSLLKFTEEDETDNLENIRSQTPNPEQQTEMNYTSRALEKALGALNPDQRSVCILHDVEGYTLVELEEILEVPIGTLKSRLHRARANLKNLLTEGTFSAGGSL